MARSRFLGFGLALVAVLAAGCGTTASPAGLSIKRPAVKVQREAWDMQGTFHVVFKGLAGYRTLATKADIARVRITLTSPRLLEPLVKEVGSEELNQLVVTVPFANVPAGEVAVKVQALDADGQIIGAKESASTVSEGQTTVLQMAVRLDALPGKGNLATTITFEDATPAPSPTPSASPTATPTPTPTPSATPSANPVMVQSYRLVRHIFTKPEAELTIKNTTDAAVSPKVYVYFYADNSLKDSQARQIPLGPGEELTFRLRSNVYGVNKVHVVAQ